MTFDNFVPINTISFSEDAEGKFYVDEKGKILNELHSVECLDQFDNGLNIFYFKNQKDAYDSLSQIMQFDEVYKLKVSQEDAPHCSTPVKTLEVITIDEIFNWDRRVNHDDSPFENDSVFPEKPDFFAGDTPQIVAKEIYQKCVDEWYPRNDDYILKPLLHNDLVNLFTKWWPTKQEPFSVDVFLFGGCRFDGWKTFDEDMNPQSCRKFEDFKESVHQILDEFGYDEENKSTETIGCDLNPDSNEFHHSWPIPSDERVRHMYLDWCLKGDLKPIFENDPLTLKEIKETVYRNKTYLRKIRGARELSHAISLDYVAQAFGFQHFHEATKALKKD